jgi:hypothetical protein
MTGRYKVSLHLDSAKPRNGDFRACWHRLINLCQSLERAGLRYDVQFSLPQLAARLARLADFAEYAHWREMARLLHQWRAA